VAKALTEDKQTRQDLADLRATLHR
jgi:hypothetical protein